MESILFPLWTSFLATPSHNHWRLVSCKNRPEIHSKPKPSQFQFHPPLCVAQHNQDMSHLALKVCKRKPSLEICNWKGWCCSTTWQPLLVLNVLLPWREKSWHKKCDPLKGYPKVFQVNISRSQKPSHVIQKYVMYIGVHNVYGTFWKTWSSTKSQQNLYPAYLYQVTKTLGIFVNFPPVTAHFRCFKTPASLSNISTSSASNVLLTTARCTMLSPLAWFKVAWTWKLRESILFNQIGTERSWNINNITSCLISRGTNNKNVRGIEICHHFSYIQEDDFSKHWSMT